MKITSCKKNENYHQWWSLAIIHAIEKMSSPYKRFQKKFASVNKNFYFSCL